MKRSFLKQLNLEPGCDNEVSLLKTSITFQKPNFPKSAGRSGELSYVCLSSKMNSIREGVGEQNYYLVLFHHHFIFAYLILTRTLHIHYKLHRIRMCWQQMLAMVHIGYFWQCDAGNGIQDLQDIFGCRYFFGEQDNLVPILYLVIIKVGLGQTRLVQDYQGLRIYQDRTDWSRIDKVSQPMIAQDRH